ncbi:hypothetical protein RND81_06G219500 [Saponaria officinalis]|uniref:Uncharacterized protein n=1 Tax=Saponaria officinalis TaxID=3572 RepID=A0AAW1KDI9_SAPOF
MKLSLKFREETKHQNPLLRAKIPVSILGLPFLSGIVAGDSSDLSFSLRSNFSAGPSLSLSYHPTLSPPPSAVSAAAFPPFSVSLKSGIGIFGSPKDSPLVFSANFNPNSLTTPTFSLFIKPQFGNFSLFKSVDSASEGPIRVGGYGLNGDVGNGSVSDFGNGVDLGDGSKMGGVLKSLNMETSKGGILSGIFVAARTSMPVAKRALLNFRWGVDFPAENEGLKSGFPVLVMNKISLERIEDVKKSVEDEEKRRIVETKVGDLELLKGMCGWMRKEVEELHKENREMRLALEGLRAKPSPSSRNRGEEREKVGKKAVHSLSQNAEGMSGFERWRSNKNGGGNGGGGEACGNKEVKSSSSELENELQKAIKAASA